MSLRWNDIKSFNSSQNNAFEELVCQLARAESIEGKKEFYRVAAPDGGVEAYCVLESGEEYGWQAKYVPTMGDSQWKQVKKSFERTLNTHPKLIKYFICIPLDRQDPRPPNQEWFMDRWKKKVAEWTEYARAQDREITFEYWGSSELVDRLSLEKHAGRKLFWFSQEDFSDHWFSQHIEKNVDDLGIRYTAKLNIELEIADNFAALSRNERFREILRERFHEIAVQINKALDRFSRIDFEDQIDSAQAALEKIIDWATVSQREEFVTIDTAVLEEQVHVIEGVLSEYRSYLDKIESEKDSKDSYRHQSPLYEIYEAQHAVSDFVDFIQSQMLELANNPALLLVGPAGIGKSHLLADIALNRIKSGKACILLLGQHFSSEETPWTQILRNLLRLNCNERELLGVLNAKAESQRERLLFIIDAVNEGKGKDFWPDHIRGFINGFSQYPWLGLVLSIRDSYEDLIIPKVFIEENKLVKIVHSGFKGIEYQASSFFFAQHGIAQPRVPLLHPEFSNPLFLKLFCEGLSRSGLHQIPEGYGGITSIIDFFLESIDEKLTQSKHFVYLKGRRITRKVINGLIEHKLKNDLKEVPYADAYDIVDRADSILSKFDSELKLSLLESLISEGVLSKDSFWQKDNYVYLAYERFEDHLTASYLLDKYLTSDTQASIFKQGGALYQYIEEAIYNRGILEAFSIQVPERTGNELNELIDKPPRPLGWCLPSNQEAKADIIIVQSFIYSLLWRKTESIKEETKEYVNEYILKHQRAFHPFFQLVYAVAADPAHLYNANYLHTYLMQFSLADRDGLWTTYLHDQDYQETAMRRLIDWARSEEDKSYLSDESRLLAAKALAWLFTSTNIPFRDAATKALVVLLENNLPVIIELLKAFEEVNDPYVVERIFAAAYGAVLRSERLAGIAELSGYIIENIFKVEEVYPNILVRDYARNIIEYAHHKGCLDFDDLKIIRPPYCSSFPTSFPTDKEMDTYSLHDAYYKILESMRGEGIYGDFGRDKFQSRIDSWGKFNLNKVSNYACKLIFEKYGYDIKKHGDFDKISSHDDIYRNKKERISRKYQWITLYEILARLADNYKMVDHSSSWKKKRYRCQGPWEPFVRNIDPTVVGNRSDLKASKHKTYLHDYADWQETHEKWIVSDKNLPTFEEIITSNEEWLVLQAHPSWYEPVPMGKERNEHPRKNLNYSIRSYFVQDNDAASLLDWLKDQRLNNMGSWLPDSHSQHTVFKLEYYWSPAYRFFDKPYYGGYDWENIDDPITRCRKGVKVLSTAEIYHWGSGAEECQMEYFAPRDAMFHGMNLQHSNNAGEWLDEQGEVVCFDASVGTGEIPSLLIKKELLEKFLSENKLQIFWACLGKKYILGGHSVRNSHSQWLELSGIYTLRDGQLKGEMKTIIAQPRN